MSTSDQDEIFEVLEKQRQNQLKVDRILKSSSRLWAFAVYHLCQPKLAVDLGHFYHADTGHVGGQYLAIIALDVDADRSPILSGRQLFQLWHPTIVFLRLQLGCMLFLSVWQVLDVPIWIVGYSVVPNKNA